MWDEAGKLERAKERFDRTGVDGRKFNQSQVDQAWAVAVEVFEQVCREEKAWPRLGAALAVFRPDGQLNERPWAEEEVREALTELTSSAWAKVRRQLQDTRTFTFLDRLHENLVEVEPSPEHRQALVALWRWRRAKRQAGQEQASSTVGMMEEMFQELVRAKLGQDWKEAYRRVSQVLARVVRASSWVECVNRVVRMHQSRHRNLTQELLDLKRLFWNCRGFLEGKRKGHCPYELLGLLLPS